MIARLISISARNPLAVFVVFAVLLAGAGLALTHLPLDAIPDLSDPQVIVFSEWMGRSPDLVEDQVTYPIVAQLISAPDVTDVRGFSMFGMSFVYVIFKEGTDLYWARSRVMEYMSALRSKLPPGVTPTLGPDATSIGWIFEYALIDKSGSHSLAEIRTFQDYTLRYALQTVPGVAEVASVGGYVKQYQVEVDPVRLAAYNLSISDLIQAVRRSNNDVGGQLIEASGREYFVRGRGYITDPAQLEQIVLRSVDNTPVLLGQVARVSLGPDARRGVAELDGQGETVGATVVMRYGENAQQVIDNVKQRLEELRPSFPAGLDYQIVYDRSDLIGRAINTLKHALLQEGLVVALVILLFLLHLRSSLVAIVTLPVAVLLSFIPMYLLGITSNIMSLGGIAVAIGAMVDASIVLIENSHKHLERIQAGQSRRQVIIEACQEVGPAIFFSLLILTAAFLPVFGLAGQAGRLFRPLAFTKTFAMAFAAIVSITLTPALLPLLLRGRTRTEERNPLSRVLIALYRPFIQSALRHPRTFVLIGLLVLFSAVPVFLRLGEEFMPPLNEGDILYMPTTMPGISLQEAQRSLQIQDQLIKQFPEVESVFGKAGRMETATDPAPLSMIETMIKLRPQSQWRKVALQRWYSSWAPAPLRRALGLIWPEQRTLTWDELVAELNSRVDLPGWTNAWTMPIKTRIDMLSTGVRTPVGIKILGRNLRDVEAVGLQLEHVVGNLPHTRSAFYERNSGGYYIDIVPRPAALASYGLQLADLQMIIESAIGGQPIESTIEGRERYTINVRYARSARENIDRLAELPVLLPGSSAAMGQGSGAARATAPAGPGMTGMGGGISGGTAAPVAASAPQSGSGATAPKTPEGLPGRSVPLSALADVRISEGPPMIRDEGGMLTGYVYVDVDQSKIDIGSYVDLAKIAVRDQVSLPEATFLKWTGQFELLEQVRERMKLLLPLTLLLVLLLLYFQFRSVAETLIVFLSLPFALVGSIWLLHLLGYNISTAVWVGMIALLGLAAETGIVMMVYLDAAYNQRKEAGLIRTRDDIKAAHIEGALMRVRPKIMTVGTTFVGLIPLLWAVGAGADVMRRIAAPMIGGLISSTFLTLVIIPVVATFWRQAQLKRETRGSNASAQQEN